MSKAAWKPWHHVVQLRPDVVSGELSLAQFAADLYDVTMDRGTLVYRDPAEFFALTFPTYNLRELAKDVVHRLAGKNDKTIRQLELTYGGGKTHTLITLLHLVRDPRGLPDLPAVHEFLEHFGMTPPRTRVAALAFDKLDAEKGMEAKGPAGERRWLKHPDQIKSDPRARIQETAVSAGALLPDGPYDLWRSGETSRGVKDLVGAFAQFPHLPKMLNRQSILDTLIQGCQEGQFVLRVTRPDRSTRTIWRRLPDDADLKNSTMEVVLPEFVELSDIEPGLLVSGMLTNLWSGPDIAVADVRDYFSGGKVIKVARQGCDDPVTIPKAPQGVVDEAIVWAVKEGKLWLTIGPTSLFREDVPAGLLTDTTRLRPPPAPVATTDLLPKSLPNAWAGGRRRRERSPMPFPRTRGSPRRGRSSGPPSTVPARPGCWSDPWIPVPGRATTPGRAR